MLDNFDTDLAWGKRAERIVARLAQSNGVQVQDISDLPQYRQCGDLLITLASGQQYYLEVKNDSVVGSSGNILCEEEVYYKENDYFKPGFMYNHSDFLLVVSESQREIYVLDFKIMQQIYKTKGQYKFFDYPQQSSDCYLVPLWLAKKYGAWLETINY